MPRTPRSRPTPLPVEDHADRGPRLAVAAVVVLLWAVALLVDPSAREAFRQPKAAAGAVLGLVSIAVLLATAAPARLAAIWHSEGWRAVGPMVLVATALAPLSTHGAHVREALPGLWIGASCLIGWSVLYTREQLRSLVAQIVWPALALAAVGLLQATGLFQPFTFADRLEARFAVTSLAGNVGDFGAALVLPALVAQVLFFRARRAGQGGWLAGTTASVLTVAILATQTLAAGAALLVGSLVLWATLVPRRAIFRAAAVLLVVAAVAVVLFAPLRGRVAGKLVELGRGDVNAALTGRLDGWRAAVWMMARHPLTGVGLGAFVTEYAGAKLALAEAGAYFLPQRDAIFAEAHNDLLQFGAEVGLPGLLALGWGLALVGRRLRRGFGSSSDDALARGGSAALAVLTLVYFPWHAAVVAYPALVFVAWLLADAPEPGRATPPSHRRVGRIAALVVMLAALAALHVAWQALAASRIVRQVEGATYAVVGQTGSEAGRRVLEANLSALAEAERLAPADVSVLVARGSQHLLLGHADAAIRAYRAALALEPRPETHLNLARALRLAGRDDEARAELAIAFRLAPLLQLEVAEKPAEGS